jgi:hypothetical protein
MYGRVWPGAKSSARVAGICSTPPDVTRSGQDATYSCAPAAWHALLCALCRRHAAVCCKGWCVPGAPLGGGVAAEAPAPFGLDFPLPGMEDIPQGVTAVLYESTTDMLSHVAIRACGLGSAGLPACVSAACLADRPGHSLLHHSLTSFLPAFLPVSFYAIQLSSSGMEDIPQGVTAVLTESTTDVLSHVAIRARSQGVLLATCFDDAEWNKLTAMKVQWCRVAEGSGVLALHRAVMCSSVLGTVCVAVTAVGRG